MVGTYVVLALVLAKDFFPWVVFCVEFSLFNSVCEPKKSHCHQSLAVPFDFDGVVLYADGCCVIAVYYCWELWMSPFFKRESKNGCLFAI